MAFLFTSESVSEGHPDKVADQISDAILDEFLRHDPQSKVACETLCTTGLVVVSGEVKSDAYVDVQGVARRVIDRIGYNRSEYQFDAASCGILSAIHEQSSDINQGVERESDEQQGAGDQGIMFGYACNETREFMPATLILSHVILKELAVIRREGIVMTYLRPDSKSQVTMEYDELTGKPQRVHTIVVSTQHDEFIKADANVSEKEAEILMQEQIREDVRTILIPRVKARLERANDCLAGLIGDDYILHVNPTGKFVIGGLTAIQVLQVVRLLLIPTVVVVLTVVVRSLVRIHRRWTARQPMQRVTSQRIWWQQVLPIRCWCSSATQSVSQSHCQCMFIPILQSAQRRWRV